MPLLGFRPTKARLVMEDDKDSVLVMKVVLDGDDAVELATGGTLQQLAGVLRIRERRNHAPEGGGAIGSLVYVAEAGAGSASHATVTAPRPETALGQIDAGARRSLSQARIPGPVSRLRRAGGRDGLISVD